MIVHEINKLEATDSVFSANIHKAQQAAKLREPVFEQDVEPVRQVVGPKPNLMDESPQDQPESVESAPEDSNASMTMEKSIRSIMSLVRSSADSVRGESAKLAWNTELRDTAVDLDAAFQDLQGLYEQMSKFNLFG